MDETTIKKWYEEHKKHVDGLVNVAKVSYAPSKGDARNPALWKGEHWKWFLELKEENQKAFVASLSQPKKPTTNEGPEFWNDYTNGPDRW